MTYVRVPISVQLVVISSDGRVALPATSRIAGNGYLHVDDDELIQIADLRPAFDEWLQTRHLYTPHSLVTNLEPTFNNELHHRRHRAFSEIICVEGGIPRERVQSTRRGLTSIWNKCARVREIYVRLTNLGNFVRLTNLREASYDVRIREREKPENLCPSWMGDRMCSNSACSMRENRSGEFSSALESNDELDFRASFA